ncbi:hypothetical protein PIB30_094697 [Stylosanthes scabra]|uniref:Uncharacterized protein n=1 Tax=Stylosanthes scabra TaxID=79078 RepID=A0ABU6ZU52_9FABA|nr:hypothetical protein [Stylosanthes scabra]
MALSPYGSPSETPGYKERESSMASSKPQLRVQRDRREAHLKQGGHLESRKVSQHHTAQSKEQLPRPVKLDTAAKIHLVDLELLGKNIPKRPQLEGELDKVQIGPEAEQVTMIAKNLSEEVKSGLTHFLKKTWTYSHGQQLICQESTQTFPTISYLCYPEAGR